MRQRGEATELETVPVLEPGELGDVQSADVGAAPLLVGLARRRQALEGSQRAAPALVQPVGLALERCLQGFLREAQT